jgi:flagellar hook-associated protein 3 FlgL
VDTAVQSAVSVYQRIRVLAVQMANGTYSNFETKEAAAVEVNQLMEELLTIANYKGATGRPVFGGYKTGNEEQFNPFVPIYGSDPSGNQMITGVQYRGDAGQMMREVSKGEYLSVNIPGNQLFWATNQIITANKDISGYVVETNQSFKIDGKEISVSPGDNINNIIDKINNSGAAVKAARGLNNNLVLETTTPHQLWLENVGSADILVNVGLVNPDSQNPPNNFDPTASISGMSVFDSLIKFRSDLIDHDQEQVGGADLSLIDMGMDNLLHHLAAIGAKHNRLEELEKRTETEKVTVMDLVTKNEGVDYAESIMNFKWLETVHAYALSVGAKTIKPTLMDFLR